MSDKEIPLELDWVKARSDCSLAQVFKAIQLGVKNDVDAVNSLIKPGIDMKFSIVNVGQRFSVVCEVNHFPANGVDFHLQGEEILIDGHGGMKFRASLTLTNDGNCKLRVNDEELEQWQLRRKALEGLFFDGNQGRYL